MAASVIEELIGSNRLALFGIVRQELLSGINHQEQFDRIELDTRALSLCPAEDDDHITAARFFNVGGRGSVTEGTEGVSHDILTFEGFALSHDASHCVWSLFRAYGESSDNNSISLPF
jgi:hypothetical protein